MISDIRIFYHDQSFCLFVTDRGGSAIWWKLPKNSVFILIFNHGQRFGYWSLSNFFVVNNIIFGKIWKIKIEFYLQNKLRGWCHPCRQEGARSDQGWQPTSSRSCWQQFFFLNQHLILWLWFLRRIVIFLTTDNRFQTDLMIGSPQ